MRLACRDWSSWVRKGATIVTPTPFLAGVAHEEFARAQLKEGSETWERPAIFGLDAWLASCWQEARYVSAAIPSLLSPAQEQALWHGIIELEHPQLFDVSATVRLAREAARLLAEWNIPSEGQSWNDHADARQFQHWRRLLHGKSRENNWITRADLLRQIPGWMSERTITPKLTVFVGFEHISPALENIQTGLGSLAVRLPFSQAISTAPAVAKSCDDSAAEVEFAARRLRYLFEEAPGRSLALLVPNLAEHTALIERTLQAVFFPTNSTKFAGTSTTAESLFRMHAGSLLIDHPLIASALLFLGLASPRIDHADAGAILRSHFLKGASGELHQRALADIDLRKRRELDVGLQDMAWAARKCVVFSSCLKNIEKLLPKAHGVHHLAEWSRFICDLLGALGWPGDREPTEGEKTIIDQWNNLLSTLSGLGLVTPAVSLHGALGHLRRLLARRLEKGDWSSPIQVLDASEAKGVEFDSAIAVGLSEESWPNPVRLSPLVPLTLQRLHQVPGSTPKSVRDERRRATKALFSSAPQVFVTFHERLSSLAESFVSQKNGGIDIWDGPLPQESFALATLEQISDANAPPFAAKEEMRGGTGIIKAQSQCPFRAFAEYRLKARSPEDASFGFDARERGGFVHKALENVWKELESQGKLRQTSQDELRLLVRHAIADAVQLKDAGPLHELSVGTERERLEQVILEWLQLESSRSVPFTVEQTEQERKFEVPGLSLSLRVDRIDRLNNGNLVLIDYKSGKQSRPKLTGERPAEPQLLVYAASVESPVDGIFFGQVKPREVKAIGFSRNKHFSGSAVTVHKEWGAYMEESRASIEKLAHDFVRGAAEVDPIKGACEYCGTKPFCRINERGALPTEEEE